MSEPRSVVRNFWVQFWRWHLALAPVCACPVGASVVVSHIVSGGLSRDGAAAEGGAIPHAWVS